MLHKAEFLLLPQSGTQAVRALSYGLAGAYLVVEALAYRNHLREVKRVEESLPPGATSAFDEEHWRSWFTDSIKNQPRPADLTEAVFQAPLKRESRERALHWLCFMSTMRELESYGRGGSYPSALVRRCALLLDGMDSRGHSCLGWRDNCRAEAPTPAKLADIIAGYQAFSH